MLDIIEGVLKALGAARNDTDIVRILDQLATRFGFRSAYLIEYAGRLTAVQRVLDTDPNRRGWWSRRRPIAGI